MGIDLPAVEFKRGVPATAALEKKLKIRLSSCFIRRIIKKCRIDLSPPLLPKGISGCSARQECQMTNPFNRGTSPGRERDASQRPGTFEPGQKRVAAVVKRDAKRALDRLQTSGYCGRLLRRPGRQGRRWPCRLLPAAAHRSP